MRYPKVPCIHTKELQRARDAEKKGGSGKRWQDRVRAGKSLNKFLHTNKELKGGT